MIRTLLLSGPSDCYLLFVVVINDMFICNIFNNECLPYSVVLSAFYCGAVPIHLLGQERTGA